MPPEARESQLVTEPDQIYAVLGTATGLQEKVVRLGLAYSAGVGVREVNVSFSENNEDPEYTICSVTFEASKIQNFNGTWLLAPKNPQVTIEYGEPCASVDLSLAKGPWGESKHQL